MGVYPECAKKEQCREDLGYLWKTSNCTYCPSYVAVEVHYDFRDKPSTEALPEGTDPVVVSKFNKLSQDLYALKKEYNILRGIIEKHVENHGKGGGSNVASKQSKPTASGVII